MRKLKLCLYLSFVSFLFTSSSCSLFESEQSSQMQLWYNFPASNWNEALPVGNGYMGAMVFSGVRRECLQLNESTLYSGEPSLKYKGVDIRPLYNEVCQLLNKKEYGKAHKLVKDNWQGVLPQSYQPLGYLYLDFDHTAGIKNYKRVLDLEKSMQTTTYEVDGVTYSREIFASYPDKVIVVKLKTNSSAPFSVKLSYDSQHPTTNVSVVPNGIFLKGQAPGYCERRSLDYLEKNKLTDKHPELFNEDGTRKHQKQLLYGDEIDGKGMFFESGVRVLKGNTEVSDNYLSVTGKREIILVLAAATSYNGLEKSPSTEGIDYEKKCKDMLEKASKKTYSSLLKNHQDDYKTIFDRVSLTIHSAKDYTNLSTDVRLENFVKNEDNGLINLLFQYGRYLLISSSREGGQSANLQGIWNDKRIPPWNCGYTMNINAETNYWHAETTGLTECLPPFFNMIKELSESGKESAKNMYGLPGWAVHHNASIWREAFPTDGEPDWFFWNMSGAWLCRHLWEHYLFNQDMEFLRNQAYPLMKNAAEFYEKWLVQDENGHWQTPISTSPENRFLTDKNEAVSVSPGSTMDMAILSDLFKNTIVAAEKLGLDETFRTILNDKRKNLLPYKVGSRGQLQEWKYDFKEQDPQHRHISHLYGFYPAYDDAFKNSPELIPAVKRSMELRGDVSPGWSLCWKVNVWARLQDGDHAFKVIQNLFTPVSSTTNKQKNGGLYPNLLDAYPPFQIDGNFGFTAGIVEMLLQSHDGELHILPALPSSWKDGSIKGLRARGGFIVDIKWQEGKPKQVKIKSLFGNPCLLKIFGKPIQLDTKSGEQYSFDF